MATTKTTHTPDLDGEGDHYENCGFPSKPCHCLALIASAPELLAAAKAILANEVPSDGQWKAFEAAIAKAEGR